MKTVPLTCKPFQNMAVHLNWQEERCPEKQQIGSYRGAAEMHSTGKIWNWLHSQTFRCQTGYLPKSLETNKHGWLVRITGDSLWTIFKSEKARQTCSVSQILDRSSPDVLLIPPDSIRRKSGQMLSCAIRFRGSRRLETRNHLPAEKQVSHYFCLDFKHMH